MAQPENKLTPEEYFSMQEKMVNSVMEKVVDKINSNMTNSDEKQRQHLRDFFAATALQGLLINNQAYEELFPGEVLPIGTQDGHEWLAGTAYELADDMLKAREKNVVP